MNKLKNIKGETLLETLIAFVILGIGIAFSGIIMGASLRNMDNYKNRIIAVNVAREGIEAVRNIRDTNWLKAQGVSNDLMRNCWNYLPQKDPNKTCQFTTSSSIVDNEIIMPGRYIVYKQGLSSANSDKPTYRWRMEPINATTKSTADSFPGSGSSKGEKVKNTTNGIVYIWDGDKWIDMRTLYLVDIDKKKDTDGDNDSKNDKDFYNHILVSDDDSLGTQIKDTVLKREIIIQYISVDGYLISNPNEMGHGQFNRMLITSAVTWQKGRTSHKVELKTNITDYLNRQKIYDN